MTTSSRSKMLGSEPIMLQWELHLGPVAPCFRNWHRLPLHLVNQDARRQQAQTPLKPLLLFCFLSHFFAKIIYLKNIDSHAVLINVWFAILALSCKYLFVEFTWFKTNIPWCCSLKWCHLNIKYNSLHSTFLHCICLLN